MLNFYITASLNFCQTHINILLVAGWFPHGKIRKYSIAEKNLLFLHNISTANDVN